MKKIKVILEIFLIWFLGFSMSPISFCLVKRYNQNDNRRGVILEIRRLTYQWWLYYNL